MGCYFFYTCMLLAQFFTPLFILAANLVFPFLNPLCSTYAFHILIYTSVSTSNNSFLCFFHPLVYIVNIKQSHSWLSTADLYFTSRSNLVNWHRLFAFIFCSTYLTLEFLTSTASSLSRSRIKCGCSFIHLLKDKMEMINILCVS